jgi:hypothetical protein
MKRIGLAPWLGVTLGLGAVQVGLFLAATPAIGVLLPLWGAFAAMAVVQVLKMPVTAGRLADLGRNPDDVWLTLVPVVSLGLFFNLLRPAPPAEVRAQEEARWAGRTRAVTAFGQGFVDLAQGAAWVGPLVGLQGLVVFLVESRFGPWVEVFVKGPEPARWSATWAGLGLAGAGLLWLAAIGLGSLGGRRRTRAAWAPTLVILPGLLFAAAFAPPVIANFGREAPALFGLGAVSLAWWCTFGALFSTVCVALSWDRVTAGAVSLRRVGSFWRSRSFEAAIVAAGTTTIIYLGMQLLIVPGLLYALLMALAVHAAFIHPEVPSLRRASQLSTRVWRSLFVVLAMGVVSGALVQVIAVVSVEFLLFLGGGQMFVNEDGAFMVGRVLFTWMYAQLFGGGLPPVGAAVGSAAALVCQGAATAGLTRIYRDQVGG